ncbi:dipeptide ABC transporter ATP-binding protein [Streptomyces hygroscopicus subsp. hygroscopicus]|uniref:dipeptide ABC transporter ATP-binding protein n=1 Tax=Streptomyces hygroscopicus TaxID=1912 RepID=UPI001C660AAA|nr:dipeptide ABC transporter ATP-binding protein [Streptomyces hygroscopicus]MBW8093402.1 dipeptide ABC transporter ATP-binding protein [Streptomyces hygroscopicus subsp. hygroscopicus]
MTERAAERGRERAAEGGRERAAEEGRERAAEGGRERAAEEGRERAAEEGGRGRAAERRRAPLLDVSGLSVAFPDAGVEAVREVSWQVRPGETVGLVGESGSGKSATGLAVLGLHGPRARITGSIRLDGRELVGAGERTLRGVRGRRVSMVFQDALDALNPYRTVGAQIAEAYRLHHDVKRSEARTRAVELLERVGIDRPERRAKEYPHQFSGGMRQRVMIAAALVNEPELVIADEPTTALDATVQAQVLELLAELQREMGMAVVLVTHDFGVVGQMCSRVVVMYRGRVVEQGPTERILTAAEHPYTRALVASVPRMDDIPGTRLATVPETVAALVGPVDEESLADPSLRIAGVEDGGPGRDPGGGAGAESPKRGPEAASPEWRDGAASPERRDRAASPERRDRAASPERGDGAASPERGDGAEPRFGKGRGGGDTPLLRVRGLGVTYPGALGRPPLRAVDGVDFDIAPGESFGLVGESGSGKSTISRVLLGLQRAASGSVLFDGEDITRATRRRRRELAAGIQMVFQDPYGSLNPDRRIGDTIGAALPRGAARRERVAALLTEVGLDPELAGAYPDRLSGGMRQRVGIARALAPEPRLLVADEPVSALDVSVQAQVLNLLTQLRRDRGLAMLFISHDLTVVRHMCSRIAVLRHGRIVETGDREQIMERPDSDYTRALIEATPSLRRPA